MVKLADKIRKDEKLLLRDLKVWIGYNFLVFSEEEQEKIKVLNGRQQWFWKFFLILGPPYFMGSFAVTRYYLNWRLPSSLLSSCMLLAGLSQLGLVSSNSEMKLLYNGLYEKYRYEVLSPKYRGLKLKSGKKVYQVDEKEYTSSNFDDLKEMIFK